MSELPAAFRETWRTARKGHRCCECRHPIQRGQLYCYSSGIWDGEPRSFKQCQDCAELARDLTSEAVYPEEAPCFGQLADFIASGDDWLHVDEEHLERLGLTRCLAARRGEEES